MSVRSGRGCIKVRELLGAARGFPRAALQGQLKGQAFLRLAGVSPSSKDSTTASVASASSEAATVRALTAMRSKAAAGANTYEQTQAVQPARTCQVNTSEGKARISRGIPLIGCVATPTIGRPSPCPPPVPGR